MDMARLEQLIHTSERVLAPYTRAKAVALCGKVPLVDRFQHHAQRRLYHPILDGRYSQRARLLAPRLGDVVPSDRLRAVGSVPQGHTQAFQVRVQFVRVSLDRHVIHPSRTVVGRYRGKGRPQRGDGVEFIDQTVPLAASDPLFESRQHPCRPDGWFGPGLKLPCLSGSFTQRLRRRDCHRCSSVRSRHHVSTFLHPFAPPALPGFDATMSALTPARGCACGLLNLAHIPCSLPRRSLHFTGITFRALRLQTPHRLLRSLCHLSCQRRRLPAHRGSGLRLSIGSSPVGTAESSSCHYGLPVRLALLPTPPRDDAVTVGYRTETGIPEGDLHLSDVARLWTHDGRDKPGHDGESNRTAKRVSC